MNRQTNAAAMQADLPLQRATANRQYRADIDGLRAVAVLSVLFFHVGFPHFSGGWVGVDVFFVISGFLITRLISDDVASGTFSFPGFYARRARRLFASFIVTVAASFIAGSLVFDPVYRQHFAGEIVYALVAASNFFYWLDGGYFGLAEQYKPLLHTWSLGVEEQFYLLWPLTLVLVLARFRRLLWPLLIVSSLLSLGLAEYFYYAGNERAVFFLLPARIFEFGIGAMLVWLIHHQPRNQYLLDATLVLGLALIFVAVFGFTTRTPFPTAYALIPCLGSALAIFGGSSANLAWLLGNPLMAGIGRVSYSLYLVHWPMIVFCSYHRLTPFSWIEQSLICAGALVAAALMYVFIEQPFRDPRRIRFASRAGLGLACTSAMILLLVPASIVWARGTLFWRGWSAGIDAAQLAQLEEQYRQDSVDDLLRDRQFDAGSGRTRLMFVGDSHSGDIAAALYLSLGADRYDYARLPFPPACFASADRRPWILRITDRHSSCESQVEALRKSRSLPEADYLFIADRWTEDEIGGFSEGLALLRSLSRARIVLVGQNATFLAFDDSLRFLGPAQLQRLNSVFYQQQSLGDERLNEQLKGLAAANGLGFIDRQSLVCSRVTQECDVRAGDGRFFYTDSNHWSYTGRTVFGQRMVQQFGQLFGAGH